MTQDTFTAIQVVLVLIQVGLLADQSIKFRALKRKFQKETENLS